MTDFSDFLMENRRPVLRSALSNAFKGGNSVVDLGCGYGMSLWVLYHDFGFTDLVGVDNRTLDDMVRENNVANPSFAPCDSIHDLYLNLITGIDHLNRSDFERTFKYMENELYTFGHTHRNKYDLVLCNDVLHYAETLRAATDWLNGLIRLMKPDAHYVVKVKEKPACWTNDTPDYTYVQLTELIRRRLKEIGPTHRLTAQTKEEGETVLFTNLLSADIML